MNFFSVYLTLDYDYALKQFKQNDNLQTLQQTTICKKNCPEEQNDLKDNFQILEEKKSYGQFAKKCPEQKIAKKKVVANNNLQNL